MRNQELEICIVGGGFTGVAGAIVCLVHIGTPFRLTVVEPAALGSGVAFGGHHSMHLLNVRTRDLSIRAGQPGDFLNWAFRQLDQGENHAGLHEGLAHTFLPRQLFGEYVRERFFDAAERRKDVELKVVRATATGCGADRGHCRLVLDGVETISADVVILATAYGLASSAGPGALPPYGAVEREQLARAKTMALVGSGLTMVDVLLNARREGFSGTATIISRRGQLPRPHAARGVVPHQVGLPKSKRISLLTAAVRIACELAEVNVTPWQAVINGLRGSVQDVWQGLSAAEQARFLRHVRPFWNAHRHRVPLEVHGHLQSELDSGRATLMQARVKQVIRHAEGFEVRLNRRGSAETLHADLAVDCTGHSPDLEQPLIQDLIVQGLARPDPHRLGLAVKRNGEVQGADGSPKSLFALGPLGQGSLWEITAVPEIVVQADRAAAAIAALYAPHCCLAPSAEGTAHVSFWH
jgi:uncharacterized NAD(P)/FAD-binding protein YdhS